MNGSDPTGEFDPLGFFGNFVSSALQSFFGCPDCIAGVTVTAPSASSGNSGSPGGYSGPLSICGTVCVGVGGSVAPITVTGKKLPKSTSGGSQNGLSKFLKGIWTYLTAPCAQVANEPRPVFVDFLGGDAIFGGGGTASVGVFKNLKTGSGGFFFTYGCGAGASFGGTIQAGFYNSAADLQGPNVNVGGAIAPASGTLNFSPTGRLVGATVGPGAKLGGSVTATSTSFIGCALGG